MSMTGDKEIIMHVLDCPSNCPDTPPSLQNLSLETQSTANVSASSLQGRESNNESFFLSVEACEIYRQLQHPLPRNMRFVLAFFTSSGIHDITDLSEIPQRHIEITNDEESAETMERILGHWDPRQLQLPEENVDLVLGLANEAKSDSGPSVPILPIAWAPLDMDEYRLSSISMTIELDVLEDLNDFPLLRVANPFSTCEQSGASPALPRDLEYFNYDDEEYDGESNLSHYHSLAKKILSSIAVRKATIQLDLRSKTSHNTNSTNGSEPQKLQTQEENSTPPVVENQPTLFSSFKRGTLPKVASRDRGTTNPATLWMTRTRTASSNQRRHTPKARIQSTPVQPNIVEPSRSDDSSKNQGENNILLALQNPIAMVLKGQHSLERSNLNFRNTIAASPVTITESVGKSTDSSIDCKSFDFSTIIVKKKPVSLGRLQSENGGFLPSRRNKVTPSSSTNVVYHGEVESEALEKFSFLGAHADDDATVCTTIDNGKSLVVFSAPRRRRLNRVSTFMQSASNLMFPPCKAPEEGEEDMSTLGD